LRFASFVYPRTRLEDSWMLDEYVTRTIRIAEAIEDAIGMFSRWPGAGWDVETFCRTCGCDHAMATHIFRALEQFHFIRQRVDGLYVHDPEEPHWLLRGRHDVIK
jgi:hypothetical protein